MTSGDFLDLKLSQNDCLQLNIDFSPKNQFFGKNDFLPFFTKRKVESHLTEKLKEKNEHKEISAKKVRH